MNKKQELNTRLMYFTPEIVFDGAIGGIKLVMTIEAFTGQIVWSVQEGDHSSRFQSFDEACNYYIKTIGEK